ncbi:hypothetical protein DER45DRAFT_214387 [Fusarium avenaceum]|nr:hypothetical protein DER45DRAFT_214387 [Fusarium avenaceum]
MNPPHSRSGSGSGPQKQRAGGLPTPSTTESSGESEEPCVDVKTARYRAAWPELRPLPLERSRNGTLAVFIQPYVQEIEATALTIVEECLQLDDTGVDNEIDIELVNQQMVGAPETSVPTVMISAPWCAEKKASWEKAVNDIAVWLHKLSVQLNFKHGQIHIDMIAPELTTTVYYGPVSDDTDTYDSWDQVRDIVYQRLENFQATKERMTAICLFHYGHNKHIEANPVTVYISVDYKSDETQWPGIITDIERNIHSYGWTDVQLHIEHNMGMHHLFPLLPPTGTRDEIKTDGLKSNKRIQQDYQQSVNMGEDFGSANYITRTDNVQKYPGLATLGCFIELKSKNNPEWKKYAITNYHAVRPAFDGFRLEPGNPGSVVGEPRKDSDLRKVDRDGFYPNKKIRAVPLESPSRAKHNFTIWSIDDDISTWTKRIKELENNQGRDTQAKINDLKSRIQTAKVEKQKKLEFFNNGKQTLGRVYAASGFMRRTADNMRLDWALIDIDEHRQGFNRLPAEEVWKEHFQDPTAHPYRTFGITLQDQSSFISPNNPGASVWKVGTVTGPTTAKFNKKKQACRMSEDSYLQNSMKNYPSTEYIFQPHYGGKFCAHGDSGSIVFDKNGGVVGLFFRGHKINKSFDDGWGMITPIEHVFEDIKKFSNGAITAIRVARDP